MNFIEKHTKKVALILCLATAGTAVTTVYAATTDGMEPERTAFTKRKAPSRPAHGCLTKAEASTWMQTGIRLSANGRPSTVLFTTSTPKDTV